MPIKKVAILDGSEILGIFLNDRLGISIGKVILLFNTILFAATAKLLSIEVAMYSILTFIITAKIIVENLQKTTKTMVGAYFAN